MDKKVTFYILITFQILFLLFMAGTKIYTLKMGKRILLEVAPVDPRDIFRGEYVELRYKISRIDIPVVKIFKKNDIVYVTLKKGEKFWEVETVTREKPPKGSVYMVGKVKYHPRVERINKMGNFSDVSEMGWLEDNSEVIKRVESLDRWECKRCKIGETRYIPFEQVDERWVVISGAISTSHTEVMDTMEKLYTRGRIVIISAEVLSIEEKSIIGVKYGIESYFVPEGKAGEIEGIRAPAEISAEVCVDRFGNS
ncbi:TPA: hypothetical protein DCX15_02490, partial [bacterium]|nr:hypothetical protein [bacterium]